MRKKLFLGAVITTALFSWAAKDPVLMKINGDDVKLSEFEYLYHKNNQQQIEKETLEQYLDRFVVYKLKVADAKAAGIDTTKSFKKEFHKYRDDLARPYMVDSATIKRLVEEAYGRKTREVEVAHIMMSLSTKREELEATEHKLDSIRTCILNGQDFGSLALKYSIDPSVNLNNGNLGFITSGRYPLEFEDVAYTTKMGEISKPFKTDYGIHIVKVLAERPCRGEVLVEHILKLFPRGANDSIKNVKRQELDSIYNVVKAGANFEELAKAKSEDPGSAQMGGKLRWFGAGMMVPQFEDVAFSLKKGEISAPFETAYGVHIIKKLDSRGIGSLEENKAQIMAAINSDQRSTLPREAKLAQFKKEYKFKENEAFFKKLEKQLEANKYDSIFVDNMKKNETVVFSFAKEKTPMSEVATLLDSKANLTNAKGAVYYIKSKTEDLANDKILEYAKSNLGTKYPEYGNLLNEYYNGMMLYEISNRNVWDKANRDTEGLENYFNNNKSRYTWTQPKFKGTIIYTTSDSVQSLVKDAVKNMAADTLVFALKKKFKRDVKIEKLLVQKGDNPVVDALVFGGENAQPKDARFKDYFMYEGRIIDQPEEAADVRGQVTSDYQNYLEENWVKQLKDKYPVLIDKKVLKQVK